MLFALNPNSLAGMIAQVPLRSSFVVAFLCLSGAALTIAQEQVQKPLNVPTTYGDAMRWYENAAQAGHPQAQFYLGYMYETGARISRDPAKAAIWYQRAGEQGHAQAQHNLGQLYHRGDGLARDLSKAAEWYRRAAGAGLVDAQYVLGVLLETGDGIGANPSEAAQWYQRAADQGSIGAANNLAIMLISGAGLAKDVARAIELYRTAANAGLANAQFNLAAAYINGEGITPDYVAAHRWLVAAARQRDDPAVAEQAAGVLAELEKRMTPAQLEQARKNRRLGSIDPFVRVRARAT